MVAKQKPSLTTSRIFRPDDRMASPGRGSRQAAFGRAMATSRRSFMGIAYGDRRSNQDIGRASSGANYLIRQPTLSLQVRGSHNPESQTNLVAAAFGSLSSLAVRMIRLTKEIASSPMIIAKSGSPIDAPDRSSTLKPAAFACSAGTGPGCCSGARKHCPTLPTVDRLRSERAWRVLRNYGWSVVPITAAKRII